MNILFFYYLPIDPQKGGTERVTDILSNKFLIDGHNVYQMALNRPIKDTGIHQNVPIFYLPNSENICAEENIFFLEKFISDHRIDVLINQGAVQSDDIWLCNHQVINTKIKIFSVVHFSVFLGIYNLRQIQKMDFSFKHPYGTFKSILKWLKIPYNRRKAINKKRTDYKFMYEFSDRIIFLSDSYIKDFESLTKIVDRNKVIAIPNPNTYLSIKKQKKQKVILYVGSLQFPQKRVDRLLLIWGKVCHTFKNWSLKIVGDGPEREKLQELSNQLNLINISFEGKQNPEDYYAVSQAICITSNYEGFPMVITEAMQYGVIPIAFDTFSASDIIEDGISGYIVPPFSIDQYVLKLTTIMQNEPLRLNMSTAAQLATQRRTIDQIADRWYDEFKK